MDFERFVVAESPALLRLARALSGDQGTAEDLLQEVLIKASAQWHRISGLEAPVSYIRRMLVNEYVSWGRKWWRVIPLRHVSLEDVTDHAGAVVDRDLLRAELKRLPPQQQAALALRYFEGLTFDDIGRMLGCNASTARAYVSRALATLRIAPAFAEITHASEKGPNS